MQIYSFKGNLPTESAPVQAQQVGKGGKEGTNFHSSHEILS